MQEGKDIDVMQAVSVRETMTTKMDTVSLEMPLDRLALEFEQSHHHGFPVVNADGKLAGVVTIQDFERVLDDGSLEGKTVAEIATLDSLVVVYDDEPMWSALKKLGLRDVGRLPVVKREDEGELVGVIRRKILSRLATWQL